MFVKLGANKHKKKICPYIYNSIESFIKMNHPKNHLTKPRKQRVPKNGKRPNLVEIKDLLEILVEKPKEIPGSLLEKPPSMGLYSNAFNHRFLRPGKTKSYGTSSRT